MRILFSYLSFISKHYWLIVYGMEFNKTRCPAHEIVTNTVHKILTGSHFCLCKAGSNAVDSSQISSRITGKVVNYLLSMLLLAVLVSMI